MECRSRKSVQDHRAGLPGVVPRAVQPGDFIGMDLVGPLTKSLQGNTYLVTMHCHFSRFPAAIPLKDASATSLIDGFYYCWILACMACLWLSSMTVAVILLQECLSV
jgi:hypothetical protein